MIRFIGCHFKKTIIFMAIRWYLAYALSYRDIEELMLERGCDSGSLHHQSLGREVFATT